MKKLALILTILGLQCTGVFTMHKPDGWQPSRPSESGSRPSQRPQAINFGNVNNHPTQTIINAPLNTPTSDDVTTPLQPSLPGSSRPSRLRPQAINFGAAPALNPQTPPLAPTITPGAPVYGPAPMNPMHIINTQTPAQPIVTNPMHIINTNPATPTAVPAQTPLQGISAKEQKHLNKINKDLDKIDESLKEMGWDFVEAAGAAVSLNPLGAGNLAMGLGRGVYISGLLMRIAYNSSTLSKGSPEAIAARDAILPRLSKVQKAFGTASKPVNLAIEKIQEIFGSAKTAK